MIIKDTVLNLLFLHSRNVKNLSSYRKASNTYYYTHPYPLLLTPIADPADHAIINILLFLAYMPRHSRQYLVGKLVYLYARTG